MPTNRDPRLDPRKGDILRSDAGKMQREVAHVGLLCLVCFDGKIARRRVTPTLEQFRRWARNAEVIYAA